MFHRCMMCFSSSVICLLVVTCHGSMSHAYHTAHGNPGSEGANRIRDTSHLLALNSSRHNQNSSGIELKVLAKSEDENQNIVASTVDNKLVATKSEPVRNSLKFYTRRKRRGASERILLPLPKHTDEETNLPQNLHEGTPLNGQSHSPNSTHSNHPSSHRHEDHETSRIGVGNRLAKPAEEGPVHVHAVHEHDASHEHEKHHHVHPCGDEEGFEVEHSHEPSADFHQHYKSSTQRASGRVWMYAILAVIAISLCGLISVTVVPIMQKWFYHTLLQFLVGLAIGSLSGDGLLHLMPHAILDEEEDSHDHSDEGSDHKTSLSMKEMEMKAIWRSLAALSGIFFFFIAERLLGALTTYRRQKREAKNSLHTKNMVPVQREESANNGSAVEKLSPPKKNTYEHVSEKDEKETIQMLQGEASPSRKDSNQSVHEVGFHGRSSFSLEPEVTVTYRPDSDSSVVVSEHHGHGHGHNHDIPQSVSAVAWMVIMGDGLHNFCDGLAIGAAFASGDADGISTTVAVFCHELPHELGDFAMLLKTGMKVKRALFYNLVSSFLCFIGMVIGVSLGNVHSATNWVFAGTAGMFLYIALVDMLPELAIPANSSVSKTITTLLVQVLGICIGISIMLLIALYEHELHSIVS